MDEKQTLWCVEGSISLLIMAFEVVEALQVRYEAVHQKSVAPRAPSPSDTILFKPSQHFE